jgi:hypothetical protein
MVYTLPYVQAVLIILMLFNGQLCGGWNSEEDRINAFERTGLHVNDAPVEYPGLSHEICQLPIRYMVDSALDQHAVWRGPTRCSYSSDIWDAEKDRHKRFVDGKLTYKQCSIGQLLNANPQCAPRLPVIRKMFFWENFGYAFGTPFMFLGGVAILSAYLAKDVPLQKCAYVTAVLGGLWAAWGLFDSCFIDSRDKYGNAIHEMSNRLENGVKKFDSEIWLLDRSRETGILNLPPEQASASSSEELEFYKPVYESLRNNEENIQRAIQALPERNFNFVAKKHWAEVKKKEDLAFMLGGGSVAALALLLARQTGM